MKITKIKIKKLIPDKGLIGFCSFVIDSWLYVGNVAIFSRKDREGEIRLVFPERTINAGLPEEKTYKLFHPLSADRYFEIEQLIRAKFYNI